MQPGLYKLVARTNADLDETFVNQDDDGAPIDMSVGNWYAIAQLRTAPGVAPVLELSTSNSRITLGADGTIRLFVPETIMRGLSEFTGVWDLVVRDPATQTDAFLAGPAEIVLGSSKVGGGT